MRQGDVKQASADLLVAPVKLNVRLPCPEPARRQAVMPFVKRRNLKGYFGRFYLDKRKQGRNAYGVAALFLGEGSINGTENPF